MTTDPILLDFPDQFETERLMISRSREEFAAPMNEAIRESLEHLRPWMPWADRVPPLEDSIARLRRGIARWILREDLWLHLLRKSDGLYVGGSGLHRINWEVPRFEIGYWVRASLEGQGYVTEAVNAITRFAFAELGAQRVEIRCDALNARSAAVAERCGYLLEARLRCEDRGVNGHLRDTLVYSKIAGE